MDDHETEAAAEHNRGHEAARATSPRTPPRSEQEDRPTKETAGEKREENAARGAHGSMRVLRQRLGAEIGTAGQVPAVLPALRPDHRSAGDGIVTAGSIGNLEASAKSFLQEMQALGVKASASVDAKPIHIVLTAGDDGRAFVCSLQGEDIGGRECSGPREGLEALQDLLQDALRQLATRLVAGELCELEISIRHVVRL